MADKEQSRGEKEKNTPTPSTSQQRVPHKNQIRIEEEELWALDTSLAITEIELAEAQRQAEKRRKEEADHTSACRKK